MNNQLMIRISLYSFAAISITSCLMRCDYNVLFAFGFLIIIRSIYKSNPIQIGKMVLHLTAISGICDLLWMIIMIPYWNEDYKDNKIWESTSGMKAFVIMLSFIELGVKGFFGYVVFIDYQKNTNGNLNDLFTFGYGLKTERRTVNDNKIGY